MEDIFEFLLFLLLILFLLFMFSSNIEEENIEDYDITNAVLVDNFITYTKMGYPNYYLIYEFKDNSIIEFRVSSEQYYKNMEGS